MSDQTDAPRFTDIGDAAKRFNEAWTKAPPEPQIEDHLSVGDEAFLDRATVRLIQVDLECRWGRGERPPVDIYFVRFPRARYGLRHP